MKVFKINAGNPIVPRNSKDPASQFPNLRKANKQLIDRYSRIKKAMRLYIKELDKRIVTNVKYEYLIDAQKYDEIDIFIQQLLNEELLDNRAGTFTRSWWYNSNTSQAYEDATEDIINSAHSITPPEVGAALYNEVQSISPESRSSPAAFSAWFFALLCLVVAIIASFDKHIAKEALYLYYDGIVN